MGELSEKIAFKTFGCLRWRSYSWHSSFVHQSISMGGSYIRLFYIYFCNQFPHSGDIFICICGGVGYLLQCGKGFYIENQGDMVDLQYGVELGKWADNLFFSGNRISAKQNACEVIATYNAMAYLNGGYSPIEFPDLLREYEGNGTALLGNWGASPSGVDACLKRHGYETKFVTGPDLEPGGEGYEKLQSQYDVYIMSSWNREGKINKGVHTMAITKEEDGTYVVHNSTYGKTEGYSSLADAVLSYKDGLSDPISVIGVEKK